jgi:Na+/H+ antiporter NhaD/arsenite permease-like protein
MLWNSGRITSGHIIPELILPSLICMIIPALLVARTVKGDFPAQLVNEDNKQVNKKDRNIILFAGVGALAFVPVFKVITHLPPYMGVLFGLGVVWLISELLHKDKDEEEKGSLSIIHALQKIDASSILFFLGILLAIATLETGGQLKALAGWMDTSIGNENVIVMSIGLLSALVDNVPLVAGAIGMYDLNTFPVDASFWSFLAYCAGTGGSILVIGSAAGVAAMGMEKLEFFWYLKRIGWLALLGYISGAVWFLFQSALF